MSKSNRLKYLLWFLFIFSILILPCSASSIPSSSIRSSIPVHQFTISNVSQYDFYPGEAGIINITIKNVRKNSVFEVSSNIVSSEPLKVKKELSKYRQGEFGPNQEHTFQYEIYVEDDASKGVYNLSLSVLWTSEDRGVTQQQEDLNIGIEIISNPEDTKIDIISITTVPEQIKPGDNFELKVMLNNIGKSKLTQIKAGMGVNLPFSSVGSSTQQYITLMDPGQSAEVIFNMEVDKNALSHLYNFNFTLEYADNTNIVKHQTNNFGIDIEEISHVYIQDVTLEPTALVPDTEGLLLIQIANGGTNEIKNIRINIFGGEQILTQTQNFIGILRPGISASETTSFGVWVNPDIEAGEYGLNIQINYDDVNGIHQSKSNLYVVKVDEEASMIDTETITGISYMFLFALLSYGIFTMVGFQINKKK